MTMSDGSLSQDEIDALLQGTDSVDMDAGPAVAAGGALSDAESEAFQALLRDVVESQSSNLSMLTGKTVRIDVPTVQVVTPEEAAGDLPDEVAEVRIDFSDGLTGEHSYLLPIDAATRIAALMMGQEGVDLDEVAYSSLGEAMSNIAGPTTTAIGNQISGMVQISAPTTQRKAKGDLALPAGDLVVKVEYPLTIEGDMPTRLVELFDLSLVRQIVAGTSGADAPAAPAPAASPRPAAGRSAARPAAPRPQAAAPPAFGAAGAGMPGMGAMAGFGMPVGGPSVQPVQFPSLQQGGPPGTEPGNIGLLMDVYMELTVELGRTRKLVKDILTIGEGSIIELDKLAGEPVDILVNHKLIAKGEVVVIDENFGVRVTEIVSQAERMGDLGA
jgi:flagellar motor switch protein FliN